MTKNNAKAIIEAAIERVSAFRDQLESAANKKRVDAVVTQLRDAKVQALFLAQNVNVAEMTDFYETMRVVRFFYEVTRDTFNVAKCDENMFVVVKTLLNAQDADVNVTKTDIEDALLHTKRDARAHVYQRKAKIEATRQVQMCNAALKLANMQARDTLKAIDCEALKLARVKMKDAAL